MYTTNIMKNITLSADEKIIEQARRKATAQGKSLNDEFRRWLKDYAASKQTVAAFDRLVADGPQFTSKRTYSRAEMNER